MGSIFRFSLFCLALAQPLIGATVYSSPGDAMSGNPFGNIPVVVGSSPNAAARTLQQLKQILAEKVQDGELTQAEADGILSRYGGVLVVYAQGSNGRSPVRPVPTPARIIQVQVKTSAPVSTPAPVAAATPATSDFSNAPTVSVNVSAFNELSMVLGNRRRARAARADYAGSGSGASESGESRGGSWPSFGGGNDGAIVERVDRVPSNVRRAANDGADGSDLKIVSGKPKGISRANVATVPDEGSRTSRLSAGQRFRLLAGEQITDENGEPIDPPYSPWWNWLFATVLAGLFTRAGYQYHRGQRGI